MDNELVELLFLRWKPFSAESLFIGDAGVWLFLAAAAEDNYAIKKVVPNRTYYLKLHWGKTPSHAYELSSKYTSVQLKAGILYLVDANDILQNHENEVKTYLKWVNSLNP
tara:strand:- start:240 stop:569 length:330 start_codon:yes stop_codon:yes gene_type:complete